MITNEIVLTEEGKKVFGTQSSKLVVSNVPPIKVVDRKGEERIVCPDFPDIKAALESGEYTKVEMTADERKLYGIPPS